MSEDKTTDFSSPAIIDPREARRSSVVIVDLGTGRAVRARRLDMASMLFEGLVPMPLLTAAQKLVDRKKRGGSAVDQWGELDEMDKAGVKLMLQKHACASVIDPVVVEVDDGNEAHLPVEMLTLMELSAIFNATAILPTVAPATAKRFRTRAVQPDPAPVPDGEGVRETPELVDHSGPEVIGV